MPRPVRLEYAGALYHLMARGDGGRRIFDSNDDAQVFLSLLGRACGSCGWWVHAWVLYFAVQVVVDGLGRMGR
jgi:hypothetical protein